MLGWFKAIMPEEDRFFDYFTRHAEIVVAGAEALRDLLQGGDTVEHYCNVIAQRETEADEVTRQVMIAVRRTFITPFDRTDIQDLASSLDDAIDQMNKTAKVITLFEINQFDRQMQQMGEIVFLTSKLVLEAMPLLQSIGKNAARLNNLTEGIVKLEERADQLYDEGRKALFLASRKGDPMKFMVGAEIYEHLEKVVDRFEDVSNEINSIVVDHI
jgi:predicted phosphate transport protein (TIGR00153 family)